MVFYGHILTDGADKITTSLNVSVKWNISDLIVANNYISSLKSIS